MTPHTTEADLRRRLEATGQLGKMQAMIVEAAVATLRSDESAAAAFHPSPNLAPAKDGPEGQRALQMVLEYLEFLGLRYAAGVLRLEAQLAPQDSNTKLGEVPALLRLLRQDGDVAAPPPTTASAPAAPQAPAAAPEEEGGEDSTYYISKWSGKSFVRSNQVSGQQLQVEYLNNCKVLVLDPLDSMTVDDCEGGEMVIAACEGSVFLRNCHDMTIHVACKQLRTRDCANLDLRIFTTTDPVVEMSHHITFKPFHLRLPRLKGSFAEAKLDPTLNRFVHVYDFTVDEASLPTPHFVVTYPDHGLQMEDRSAAGEGAPECPPELEALLSGRLLPAASSESGQNKSYDIKAGAAVWAAQQAATAETADEAEDEEEEVEEEELESGSSNTSSVEVKMAVPTSGRPPIAVPAKAAATAASDDDYSSFNDDSSEDPDDAMKVDEDDDDF